MLLVAMSAIRNVLVAGTVVGNAQTRSASPLPTGKSISRLSGLRPRGRELQDRKLKIRNPSLSTDYSAADRHERSD